MRSDHFPSFELSPPKNSSPQDVDEQSDRLDTESNDRTFDNLESLEMITAKSVKDQFSRPEISTDADFGLKDGNEAVANVDDVAREATVSPQVKENVGSSSRDHTDFQTAGIDGSNKKDMDEPSEMHPNGTAVEIPQRSIRKRKQDLSSQSLAEERADNPKDDQSIVEALPQKGRKKVAKKPLGVPLDDRTNGVPPPKSRKKKDFARRSSLAGAGSRWEEGGLRRSSRIRTKPLKYWKGERFLYGHTRA